MLTRRQTLQALGATGLAAPLLSACGADDSASDRGSDSGLRLVEADVARSAGDPHAVAGVVDAMRTFTTDLWGVVGATGDNLALSPYSIAVALAMTTNGAAGGTARAMQGVLHVDSLATFNTGMAALTQELSALAGPVEVNGKKQDLVLAAANQLFGDQAIHWQRAFLTVLAKQYGAGMRAVDFQNAPERGRAAVNAWTTEQTHARIPQILPPGSVDTSTRLVLVDALYFKAPWQTPFEKTATSEAPFHPATGAAIDVPMMSSDKAATYVEGRHYRGARLPYAGQGLAMTVALADSDEQAALTELLADLADPPTSQGVVLTMPRWTYRVATDLSIPLRRLGMAVAFTDRADFSRMTTDTGLLISSVLHQTFVAVDEAGTEAAAATAVVMDEAAGVAAPERIVLDRPFLFVIHDAAHGTPLFVGRVADPD